jgi:hypothetical protein
MPRRDSTFQRRPSAKSSTSRPYVRMSVRQTSEWTDVREEPPSHLRKTREHADSPQRCVRPSSPPGALLARRDRRNPHFVDYLRLADRERYASEHCAPCVGDLGRVAVAELKVLLDALSGHDNVSGSRRTDPNRVGGVVDYRYRTDIAGWRVEPAAVRLRQPVDNHSTECDPYDARSDHKCDTQTTT